LLGNRRVRGHLAGNCRIPLGFAPAAVTFEFPDLIDQRLQPLSGA
jgi:hypothetical protein